MDNQALVSQAVIIDNDGRVYYLGNIDDRKLHSETVLDFIKKKYPNNLEFKKLDKDSPKATIGYYLGNVGNVTYFNEGSFGIMYLPDNINDIQIDRIYSLGINDQIGMLNYNPVDLGFVIYESIGINNDYTFKEAMDEYIDLNKEVEHYNGKKYN